MKLSGGLSQPPWLARRRANPSLSNNRNTSSAAALGLFLLSEACFAQSRITRKFPPFSIKMMSELMSIFHASAPFIPQDALHNWKGNSQIHPPSTKTSSNELVFSVISAFFRGILISPPFGCGLPPIDRSYPGKRHGIHHKSADSQSPSAPF